MIATEGNVSLNSSRLIVASVNSLAEECIKRSKQKGCNCY